MLLAFYFKLLLRRSSFSSISYSGVNLSTVISTLCEPCVCYKQHRMKQEFSEFCLQIFLTRKPSCAVKHYTECKLCLHCQTSFGSEQLSKTSYIIIIKLFSIIANVPINIPVSSLCGRCCLFRCILVNICNKRCYQLLSATVSRRVIHFNKFRTYCAR